VAPIVDVGFLQLECWILLFGLLIDLGRAWSKPCIASGRAKSGIFGAGRKASRLLAMSRKRDEQQHVPHPVFLTRV
jgi:hypothetical protein